MIHAKSAREYCSFSRRYEYFLIILAGSQPCEKNTSGLYWLSRLLIAYRSWRNREGVSHMVESSVSCLSVKASLSFSDLNKWLHLLRSLLRRSVNSPDWPRRWLAHPIGSCFDCSVHVQVSPYLFLTHTLSSRQRIQSGQGTDSQIYYRMEVRKNVAQQLGLNLSLMRYCNLPVNNELNNQQRRGCLGKPDYFRCDDQSDTFLNSLQSALMRNIEYIWKLHMRF